jgi:hypothetical protein
MAPNPGLTLADKVGIAGFVIAVVALLCQAGIWFWQHRLRLAVTMFSVSKPEPQVVVEAVNLHRVHAVRVRDVRIQWPGAELVLPDFSWNQDSRIQPGDVFQAAITLAAWERQGFPFPPRARAFVKIGSGKTFKSKMLPLAP